MTAARCPRFDFGDARLPDQFWSKVMPEPMSGCWLWVGCVSDRGYGMIRIARRATYAHRLARQAATGEAGVGIVVDHLCRVRCCVNPAHLEFVTCRENTLRGASTWAVAARAGGCLLGHQMTTMTTGRRQCRTCKAVRDRRFRATKRINSIGVSV